MWVLGQVCGTTIIQTMFPSCSWLGWYSHAHSPRPIFSSIYLPYDLSSPPTSPPLPLPPYTVLNFPTLIAVPSVFKSHYWRVEGQEKKSQACLRGALPRHLQRRKQLWAASKIAGIKTASTCRGDGFRSSLSKPASSEWFSVHRVAFSMRI